MSSSSIPPRSDAEELSVKIRASKRIGALLITVITSVVGSGGVTYSLTAAEREQADVAKRLHEQRIAGYESELRALRERTCVLERELTAEVGSRVSLTAADAEPVKARKAQTAKKAVDRFDDTASDWPCPSTAQDFAKRTQRPLWKRAANALPAVVPERR
jgi:hypothetical protein